jgi:transposase
MEELNIVGLDLAENSFQAHGSGVNGEVIFRKKLSRHKVLPFLESKPTCIVAMEACASSHYWSHVCCTMGISARYRKSLAEANVGSQTQNVGGSRISK